MPQPLAHLAMAALGITLGSAATPEMMHGMATYPISLTLLALGTVCVTLGSMLYLRYVHGWSPLSALLGAVPGALSQSVAIALETKSDEVGVAIVQTLRVALLTDLSADGAGAGRPVDHRPRHGPACGGRRHLAAAADRRLGRGRLPLSPA